MEAVLACEDLRKSYGERLAVDGVGFTIGEGETYGLLGPNGAGKTTTISMVCGLLSRDAGQVTLQGRPLDTGTVEVKAAIGFVPQEIALYPDLTAKENLRFFGKLYDLSGKELDRRMDRVLETIGLADRADERTDGLFGRHEAPSEHRSRPAERSRPVGPGRADGGRGSAEPERDPGLGRGARVGGHGGALHHPLHGGGRAALRSRRDPRRGDVEGGGHAPRADRAGGRARPPADRRARRSPGRLRRDGAHTRRRRSHPARRAGSM